MNKKASLLLVLVLGLGLTYAVAVAAGPPDTLGIGRGSSAASFAEDLALLANSPLTTVITYQGRLTDGGDPANGNYDFEFRLFDDLSAGVQVGTTASLDDVSVSGGLFTVELDFGDVFDGQALWLEIRVRPGTETGGYTVLSPRQALNAAPYALSLRPGATISGAITSSGGEGVLNLTNTQGNALTVGEASDIGLYIDSAATGVRMASVGTGVLVESSNFNGFEVDSAGGDGVHVGDAVGNGFQVISAGGDAVNVGSTGGNGVYVGSADGIGVYVNQADEHGVQAASTSSGYYGGYFENTAAGGRGVFAGAGDNATADVVLDGSSGILSSDPSGASSGLDLRSNDDVEIHLDQNNDEAGFLAVYNGVGGLVFIVDESGNLTAAGTKSAMVEANQDGPVKLYALESPENWFEDFGTASLVAGETTVAIEPVFAATVNLSEDYHVFLTPLGGCALYVAEKTSESFTVRSLDGEACSIDFDYRIVAKRLGYEDLRLEPVDLEALGEEQ